MGVTRKTEKEKTCKSNCDYHVISRLQKYTEGNLEGCFEKLLTSYMKENYVNNQESAFAHIKKKKENILM